MTTDDGPTTIGPHDIRVRRHAGQYTPAWIVLRDGQSIAEFDDEQLAQEYASWLASRSMPAPCTCGPNPNDGRYDDPDCPQHGHAHPAVEAPQPRVLYRGPTQWNLGLGYLIRLPELRVPMNVVVMEDVAGAEATEDDSHGE